MAARAAETRPWLIVAGGFVKTAGMDRANYALAKFLAEQGSETHLVGHRCAGDLARHENILFHHVPKPAGSYFLGERLIRTFGRHWAWRIARRKGIVVANGGNCDWSDMNWVHYVHSAWRPVTRAGVLSRIKARVVHKRSMREERGAIRQARVVIADSERTRRDVENKLGIDSRKVYRVYYGTDPGVFHPVSPAEQIAFRQELGWGRNPYVAFVGAIGDRRKGFDVLFEAWSALCQRSEGWDAELIVAGVGAELPAWKKCARDRGLGSRIRFLGFRDDIPQILRACDLLVSPVRYEAYGLNVHEALCCGVPAIASAWAGVAERYPTELRDLLLPDPEDVDDLVQRLLAWRPHIACWRERVLPCSRQLRGYTWDDMAREIVGLVKRDGPSRFA